jgi:hypothetical protein
MQGTTTDDAITALLARKWEEKTRGHLARDTARGAATLVEQPSIAGWLSWRATAAQLVPPGDVGEQLRAHGRIPGPLKFVQRSDGVSVCRVQWPDTAPTGGSEAGGETCKADDPWEIWSRTVTACVDDDPGIPSTTWPLTALLQELKQGGWAASVDEGRLHVNVQLPGLFRQIAVRCSDTGAVVAASLVEASEISDVSRGAMLRLASEANARLPLVRFVLDDQTPSAFLRAEVHLGCAGIPGVWLTTAVSVVHAAVTLTARELSALRNPELAEQVAAPAA